MNPLNKVETVPSVIWLTGLSGAGKSTIALELSQQLQKHHINACILDGDDLRSGLNSDLGFTQDARSENIRRTAELCKLLKNQGLIVIAALISPLESQRKHAQSIIGDQFYDVFIDTPFDVCQDRDVKGLYKAASEGKIKHFTGKSSNYEPPSKPFIHLKHPFDLQESVQKILSEALNLDI